MRRADFNPDARYIQNPVAAGVRRLKHAERQSELAFTATILKEAPAILICVPRAN